jgi:hypothetical protein
MKTIDPFRGIALFGIGFTCESVCVELQKYQENKDYQIPIRALEDSIGLVKKCIISQGDATTFYSPGNKPEELSVLLPMMYEIFPNTALDNINYELKRKRESLETIKNGGKNVDVESIISLFKNISKICIKKNSKQRSLAYLAK